jgi:hypothetical protein
MKLAAPAVKITLTFAPAFTNSLTSMADLYAAMLPQTPRMIFLFLSMVLRNAEMQFNTYA